MNQPQAAFDIGNSFQDLVTTLFHSIPKIVVFLAILIIGWLVAKALGRLVDVILRKAKFDHFVERGTVGAAPARPARRLPRTPALPSRAASRTPTRRTQPTAQARHYHRKERVGLA